MTKLLLAAAIVAALAVVASSKPLSVGDATPVTCLECTVLGDLVQVLRKQGKSKDQIDQEVSAVCAHLPMPLKTQCTNAIATQLDPLLAALDQTNGDVKKSCQSIDKCVAAELNGSAIGCLLCEVEAALLGNEISKGQTKDQIDASVTMFCQKLPQQLKAKCLQGLTTIIDPLVVELTKNVGETPMQACQAIQQCAMKNDDFAQLVTAVTTVDGKANPLDCLACEVEAAVLSKLIQQGNSKGQIEANLTMLCQKLPQQLQAQCLAAITDKVDPIIDELVKNPSENPMQVCKAVMRCSMKNDDFAQLVATVTTVNAKANPLDCLACKVEAALLNKLIHQGTSKGQIEANLTMLCQMLPQQQLQAKCLAAIPDKVDPVIDELVKNPTENPMQACQAVMRCSTKNDDFSQLVAAVTTVNAKANPLDCLACEVEAAVLNKLIQQGNSKAQIEANLTMVCQKFPQNVQAQCLAAIAQKVDPIIDELVKNPSENPMQVCQAVQRCSASNVFETLVQKVTAVGDDNKLDCVVCSVEAALLSKAMANGNTKAQIDANVTMLCQKLPQQLQQKCLDALTNKLDPLIDELVKNPSDKPKQACQAVMRCPASSVLEELVEKMMVAPVSVNNKLDCLVCSIEAALVTKALKNGNTKAQIDGNVTALCSKIMNKDLQNKCLDCLANKINPIVDELVKNPSDNPKQACLAVQRCTASNVFEQLVEKMTAPTDRCHFRNCPLGEKNGLDCLVCSVEAALLTKALKNGNSKAQIDGNVTALCSKIMNKDLQNKCLDCLANKINPLIDELVKNPSDNPKQACLAVQRCTAAINVEEFEDIATTLVAPTVETVALNPAVDCAVCGLEANLLAKALANMKTKAQIDDKLTMICNKLPAKLSTPCLQAVTDKIDPLIDALALSNNDPKAACEAVMRCQKKF